MEFCRTNLYVEQCSTRQNQVEYASHWIFINWNTICWFSKTPCCLIIARIVWHIECMKHLMPIFWIGILTEQVITNSSLVVVNSKSFLCSITFSFSSSHFTISRSIQFHHITTYYLNLIEHKCKPNIFSEISNNFEKCFKT